MPPPVTTAVKPLTEKRFEARSSSFERTEGLSDDMVRAMRVKAG